MSLLPGELEVVEPELGSKSAEPRGPVIVAALDARLRDVGGLSVRRLLPAAAPRMVGPFAFFDHMGPVTLPPGRGLDVPPHPHVGLETVTYLFDGEIIHRDSLGSVQVIRPGDVNWMTAGRGIAHSERTAPEPRRRGSLAHGLQLWVALPRAHEDAAPEFQHVPAADLPVVQEGGATLRVLAGGAYGVLSPVRTFSSLFYLDAALPAGERLALPLEHEERAAYLVAGAVTCGHDRAEEGRLLVFAPGAEVTLRAERAARLVLLGGAPLDGGGQAGRRHVWWNFVASSRERVERAKRDWKAQDRDRFPLIPGDDQEFVPAPD